MECLVCLQTRVNKRDPFFNINKYRCLSICTVNITIEENKGSNII